jgi:CheY-specific phosphatase CheX
MHDTRSHTKGYVLAAALGAMGGGLIVALATRAIPKIASQMMSGMMRNMMAQMAADGCNPAEM